MGLVLWFAAGIFAAIVARWLPSTREADRSRRLAEWFVSLLIALLAGTLATALDFGGWNELEWRAALFAFFVSLTAIALYRLR